MPGGFWKRPTTRMYAYNLDLGEHYYYPMTSYLEAERGTRGESPGALTYGERLSRRWLVGRNYAATNLRRGSSWAIDRRSASVGRGEYGVTSSYLANRAAAASARAQSEVRATSRERTPPFDELRDPYNVRAFGRYKQSLIDSSRELMRESHARQSALAARRSEELSARALTSRKLQSSRAYEDKLQIRQQEQQQQSVRLAEPRQRITDDILKRVVDVHMMPWSVGPELDEANSASLRARARISELERELEEITKKALSTRIYSSKSAAQMAKQAMAEEDAMASSYKKSKKVMIETSNKVAA